ncbi:MAG: Ig-like domain-containing protein, partial [Candidatus Sulfotelmatobacter sp.]
DKSAGGSFSANPVTTGTNGQASVSYTLPTKATSITITASAAGLQLPLNERSVAGPPASISYVSGSRQFAPPQTPLPNPLVVAVKDQYKNLVTGATVTFSDNGAGGTFSPSSTVTTGANGHASVTYITGSQDGTVNITATTSQLSPVFFVETVD